MTSLGIDKLKLCVIIVVMNEKESLETTLISLMQSSDLVHKIIVKDGSKSRLISEEEIESQYRALGIMYEHSVDNGIYDAMNQAILIAPKCDYLWFLNAGDTLSDRASLEAALGGLKGYASLPDICIFGWKTGGKLIKPWWLLSQVSVSFRAHYGWVARHQSIWFKYSIAVENLYDISYKIVADAKLISSILLNNNCALHLDSSVVLTDNDDLGICKTHIVEKEDEFKDMLFSLNDFGLYRLLIVTRGVLRKIAYKSLKK